MGDDRTAKLMSTMESKLSKNKTAREKRIKKRQESNPTAALFREWAISLKEFTGVETVPKWAGVDWGLGKKLVGQFGFEGSVRIVRYYLETWEKRRTAAQIRRDDLPGMKQCWFLRAKLQAELDGVVRAPRSKKERLERGEYNEEDMDLSPDEGWG